MEEFGPLMNPAACIVRGMEELGPFNPATFIVKGMEELGTANATRCEDPLPVPSIELGNVYIAGSIIAAI
jgi:hypothetical protein